MRPFTYERAKSPAEAAAALMSHAGAKAIAGGTNLVDLMKLEIEKPAHLVDVNGIGLDKVERTADGGLRIGALVRNTDLASNERVRREYPLLSRALLAGASGQLRNRANHGRQTCCSGRAVPTSMTPTSPCKQAPARLGLQRAGRRESPACGDGRERCLHRHAPQRHGGGDARAGCHGRDRGRQWRYTLDPDCRFPSPARRDTACGDCADLGRTDHGGDAAQAHRWGADLSQGA